MKLLKNAKELVEHLEEKGCGFNIVKKADAEKFLIESNYYLKLAAYRFNYEKSFSGKNNGKYKKLEFAYLQELSTIDMHLRKQILNMCLDIEHCIKVKLINDAEANDKEDGYNCIRQFSAANINRLSNIKNYRKGEYCNKLVEKYYPYFPIWVYVELVSFGELAHLCGFYNQIYNRNVLGFDNRLLNSVRDLRNASAHNNCLINQLNMKNNTPLDEIRKYVENNKSIGTTSRNKKLSNKFMYDFVTLIYVYFKIVQSEKMKDHKKQEIKTLFEERIARHADYFESNLLIKSSFDFLKKVVDKL